MKWDYFIHRYISTYCVVRGLSETSLETYNTDLQTFADYMQSEKRKDGPVGINASDIFDYFKYLREVRSCSSNTVHKHSVIIKRFYQGLEGLGCLEYYDNPLKGFKTVKRGVERVRDVLTTKEFKKLLISIEENTVVNIRDKAMLVLLYGTGIRASELCGIREKDINFEGFQLKVFGKGQRERVVLLNNQVIKYLKKYMRVRRKTKRDKVFFQTRLGTGISRKGLYDRVKRRIRLAGINKVISPHNLRHSFATALIEVGKHSIVTIKKMLGHKSITSTIRYLRENPEDMRKAANMHPVNGFNDIINQYLPDVRMPFQLSRSCFK